MPVELDHALTIGGKVTIHFLQYCLFTKRAEAVFLYCAQKYRYSPTAPGAMVLFEGFCAEKAIAKLSLPELLPPISLRLKGEIEKIRVGLQKLENFSPTEETPDPPPRVQPSIVLFDQCVKALRAKPEAEFYAAAQEFNPEMDALDQLPDGKLTGNQLQFVKETWLNKLRPLLVSGGFWQVSTLGQL
jgi:hypothetical protein